MQLACYSLTQHMTQDVFNGLYHSPWVVIVHLIFKLIHVNVQLLAACTLLRGHLCMLVNTIKTLYIQYSHSKHFKVLKDQA